VIQAFSALPLYLHLHQVDSSRLGSVLATGVSKRAVNIAQMTGTVQGFALELALMAPDQAVEKQWSPR
jgi:hypothetical protein